MWIIAVKDTIDSAHFHCGTETPFNLQGRYSDSFLLPVDIPTGFTSDK